MKEDDSVPGPAMRAKEQLARIMNVAHHEWVEVQFSYGGWIECSCGYRPESQEDMDAHDQEKS